MGDGYILQMKNITKTFPGVKALSDVTLEVSEASIHAICGENGAGKSTLMKVLSGVYPYGSYDGEIVFQGKKMAFKNIKDSERAGIVIIHQELTMIPELSVTENIFMGNEIVEKGLINWEKQRKRTRELLKEVGLHIDPNTIIKNMGVGQQQLVEIAKALSKNVKVLILDEPTSSLNESDSENLLQLMLGLKKQGITCIMISHKLNEIAAVSDYVTVIRDGQTVDGYAVEAGRVDENKIIKAMVGREIENRYPEHTPKIGDVILEVSDWKVEDAKVPGKMLCKNSSFYVRAGEIVGFAGLMGAGRTELMRAVFGADPITAGTIEVHGIRQNIDSEQKAIRLGIAYCSEDRKNEGIIPLCSVKENMSLVILKKLCSGMFIRGKKEQSFARENVEKFRVRTSSIDKKIYQLSGGNQQKVLLARWLAMDPEILILDEPTKGIDVGAKSEIYRMIHEVAAQGVAVIVVSSELPEIIGLSDRIYVMRNGRIAGEVDRKEAQEERILRYAMLEEMEG